MKRIFIGLFLLTALVSSQPGLRAEVGVRVEPIVNRSGLSVPQPMRLLDPLLRWSARNELRTIRRDLEQELRAGGKLPKPKEFQRYLQRSRIASSGLDPWSVPYRLVVTRKGVRVVCAGADREFETEDDLEEPISTF